MRNRVTPGHHFSITRVHGFDHLKIRCFVELESMYQFNQKPQQHHIGIRHMTCVQLPCLLSTRIE